MNEFSLRDLTEQEIEFKRAFSYPNEGARFLLRVYGPRGAERVACLLGNREVQQLLALIESARERSAS